MAKLTFPQENWFENVELRPHPWPGLGWITALLAVPDVSAAITLYGELFGLVCIFENTDTDGTVVFARLRYRGFNIIMNQEGRFNLPTKAPVTTNTMPPFVMYLYVDNVEATYARAMEHGCKSVTAPRDEVWGDRIARISDPLGYIWELAMRVAS